MGGALDEGSEGFKSLKEGQKVSFDVAQGPQGLMASFSFW